MTKGWAEADVETRKTAIRQHLGRFSAGQFEDALTGPILALQWSHETQPPGAKRALRTLRIVTDFIAEVIPPEMLGSLVDLHLIAQDLRSASRGGTVSGIFQPQRARGGRPRDDVRAAVRGRAARACTELMECGDRLEAATKTVGKVVGYAPGTVKSWRKECRATASTPATEVMRAYYSAPVPPLDDAEKRRSLILAFLKRAVDEAAIYAARSRCYEPPD